VGWIGEGVGRRDPGEGGGAGIQGRGAEQGVKRGGRSRDSGEGERGAGRSGVMRLLSHPDPEVGGGEAGGCCGGWVRGVWGGKDGTCSC
jgi:hypothetical protein